MKHEMIIGRSPCFTSALNLAKKVAKSSATILLTGESGTGKEVFAQYLHHESRAQGAFIAINCSAIPEGLLESELFGHTKGAFTGAQEAKIGLFEAAENGTLFLDEIGDLPLSLQAKLLRVLQERSIKRIGENHTRPVNCRIISATHRNLMKEVEDGRFREDLFFRVNVIPIEIPALRDRHEDLDGLSQFFLEKFSKKNEYPEKRFSADAIQYLHDNTWRGNVRELENAIERAVIVSESNQISRADLAPPQTHSKLVLDTSSPFSFNLAIPGALLSLNEVIRLYIEFALKRKGGARDQTASEIGIDRKTLYKRLKPDVVALPFAYA